MIDHLFPGYLEFPAPPSDDMQETWQRIRHGLLIHMHGIPLDIQSVADANLTINREIEYRQEPLWRTPTETEALGLGDCKDYATLKYALLFKSGLPETSLVLIIAEIRAMPQNLPHAFLLAYLNNQWLVLDNKFDNLIAPNDYINLTPLKGCSGQEIVLFSPVMTLGHA